MNLVSLRRAAIVAVAGVFTLGTVASAQVTAPVTQVITADGTFSVVVLNLPMSTTASSTAAQTTTGQLVALTTDLRGSETGFHVTISASDFTFDVAEGIVDAPPIPASGFKRVGAATITGAGSGAPTAAYTGPLDTAQKVIVADAGDGAGAYTESLPVSLDIPANTVPGVYISILTATITDAP